MKKLSMQFIIWFIVCEFDQTHKKSHDKLSDKI